MSLPKTLEAEDLHNFFNSMIKIAEIRMYGEKKSTYRQNTSFLVLKTLDRLSDNLNLNLKDDNHFEYLINLLKEVRNKMIK